MKRTLDDTWKYCLAQWNWLTAEIRAGSKLSVNELKEQWLDKHGFGNITAGCFFCAYKKQNHKRGDACSRSCPGARIDPSFICTNLHYHYANEPNLFYKKILQLNRKRKKASA